jgi:hypothetical protein
MKVRWDDKKLRREQGEKDKKVEFALQLAISN